MSNRDNVKIRRYYITTETGWEWGHSSREWGENGDSLHMDGVGMETVLVGMGWRWGQSSWGRGQKVVPMQLSSMLALCDCETLNTKAFHNSETISSYSVYMLFYTGSLSII